MLGAVMPPPARTEHDALRRDRAAGTTLDDRAPEPAVEEALPAHPMLALQQEAGNAAVSRLLARAPVVAPPDPAAAAMTAFMSHPYSAKNVHPSTVTVIAPVDGS
jgi:hypothetical protein